MKFKIKYFIIFIFLFLTEIIIAKHTIGFIRNTLGDFLCVILIYAFVKSFIKLSNLKTAVIVLLIAYFVEFLQLTNFQIFYPDKYANTLKLILGTSFSVEDIIAYTLGILTVLLIESKIPNAKKNV